MGLQAGLPATLRSSAGYSIPAPLPRNPQARVARFAGQGRPPALVPERPARSLGWALQKHKGTTARRKAVNRDQQKSRIRNNQHS